MLVTCTLDRIVKTMTLCNCHVCMGNTVMCCKCSCLGQATGEKLAHWISEYGEDVVSPSFSVHVVLYWCVVLPADLPSGALPETGQTEVEEQKNVSWSPLEVYSSLQERDFNVLTNLYVGERHVVHVDACTDQYLHLHVHVFMHAHLHTYTYSQHYLHVHICPALGRNQTLLCCAFRLHYHIQSAVT